MDGCHNVRAKVWNAKNLVTFWSPISIFFAKKFGEVKKYASWKVRNTQTNFFEIVKYMKVLNERNTVLFTKSKKLVSNSRDKRTKLSVLNHGELPAFKILKKTWAHSTWLFLKFILATFRKKTGKKIKSGRPVRPGCEMESVICGGPLWTSYPEVAKSSQNEFFLILYQNRYQLTISDQKKQK